MFKALWNIGKEGLIGSWVFWRWGQLSWASNPKTNEEIKKKKMISHFYLSSVCLCIYLSYIYSSSECLQLAKLFAPAPHRDSTLVHFYHRSKIVPNIIWKALLKCLLYDSFVYACSIPGSDDPSNLIGRFAWEIRLLSFSKDIICLLD